MHSLVHQGSLLYLAMLSALVLPAACGQSPDVEPDSTPSSSTPRTQPAHTQIASEQFASEQFASDQKTSQSINDTQVTPGGKGRLIRGTVTGKPPRVTPYDMARPPTDIDPGPEDAARKFASAELKGGKPATKNDYPWAALLTFNYAPSYIPFCSGALVAEDWILTAAHCAKLLWKNDVAWIGGTDLATDPGEPLFVDDWLCHPAYDSDAMSADLALIHLSAASSAASYLPLAGANSPNGLPNQSVTVIGYGETNDITGPLTATLQMLETTIVEPDQCQAFYSGVNDPTITSNHLCAGDSTATTCNRDSGSPLFVTSSTEEQGQATGLEGIGAASFVKACTAPGGFIKISAYSKWIDDVINHGSSLNSCPQT